MPTQDDVLGYFETLSNWGRWGDDDELGTLNHITDDVRLAAARAVRHGRSVSCAWEVAVPEEMERSTTTCPCAADMPGAEDMPVPTFRNDRRWGFSSERLGVTFHGNTITHLDSPCHIFWDGTDVQRAVALAGRRRDGIGVGGRHGGGERDRHAWCPAGRRGGPRCAVVGTGPRACSPTTSRRPSAARVCGCAPAMRCSCAPATAAPGTRAGATSGFTQAGWHASCLPWLQEREVALIGADTPQDVQPSGYDDVLMPVHAVSLVAMGLWLLDNCDLEACATTAAELGQWDFQLAVAPVRFAGTSGSPVNPIATF